MDISQIPDSPDRTRVSALGALGAVLMAAGLGAAFAIASSVFSRYMHLESIGLSGATLQAAAEASLMDISLIALGALLASLGFVAVLAAGRSPRRGRRPHPTS